MPPQARPVEFGPFLLFPQERRLTRDAVPVELGSRAMDLLILLVRHAGKVVDKQSLLAGVWPDLHVEESNLRTQIAGLRKALGDAGRRYIVNIAGRGYSFAGEVRSRTPSTQTASGRRDAFDRASTLPRRATRVIGREEDSRVVAELLSTHRLVTIHGPGGIGKTTVACAVAEALIDLFADGICFIDLSLLGKDGSLPDALASALGLVIQSRDPRPNIVSHLRDRQMLLIFDCCEPVIDAAAALAEYLCAELSGVHILTTSREALRAEGEHVYILPPMGLPPRTMPARVEELLNYPAAILFHERAVASGHRQPLSDADVPVVAEICRKVDGVALALELAGGRVGTHGLRETASLLDGHFKLLWPGRRTAPRRQQTLHATLDWSFDLVTDVERRALRCLSVFTGPFTLAEAMAIIGEDAADSMTGVLGRLTAKALLLSDTSDQTTRYRLLDTTRTYSRIKLAESGEHAATCRRHATFYRSLLAPLIGSSGRGGQGAPVSPDLYLANIRVALEWAFSPSGDARLGVEIAAGAVQLMLDQSLLRETREQAERALGALGSDMQGSRCEMALSAALGHAQMLTGDHDGAVAALERSLAIAREQEDRAYEFRLLNSLHIFHRRMGRFGQLVPFARNALAVAKSLLDTELIRATDQMLATSHHLVGDQAASHALFRACLHMGDDSLYTTPTFLGSNVEVLFVLARVLWLRGFPDQAVATLHMAERAVRPDPISTCQARALALGFHALTRDWATLESCVEQQIAVAREHALAPYEFAALAFRGEVLVRRGDCEAGVTQLRASIGWLGTQRFMLYISWFNAALAEGLARRGYLDQALTLIQEQVAEVERLGGAYNLPELLRVRGELLKEAGDPASAFESFRASMALAEEQTALSWQLRTAMSIARLRMSQGRADEAYEALAAVFGRFTEGFGTTDLQAARRLLDELRYDAAPMRE